MVGQTGQILSHNMYAYTSNNPVMRVDPSGYFFKEIGDWFYDRLDDLSYWLNEKPKNVNDSSSLGFGTTVSTWIAGLSISGCEGVLGGLMKRTYTWTNAYNGLSGVNSYVGTIGVGIMVFSTLFDLADTWQANNSNTNGDRLIKSLIQVEGTYINFTVAA